VLVSPQAGHTFAATRYSVTAGGGGAASNTCRFCTLVATALARSAPQAVHASGTHFTVSSGRSDCLSVEDGAPGCLPGLRPDRARSDRSPGFFLYGLSEDGGFDDVDESLPKRRHNSSICSASTASFACASSSCASLAATCAAITSFCASSSATRARSHRTSAGAASGDGVSSTSHHDQRSFTQIQPTRAATSRLRWG
jgi:hypothetical protein